MRRWMVTVAVVGLVLGPLLAILRFLRNPYFDDPRYIKLMRETEFRLEMAKAHSKEAARSVGKKAEFHLRMEAKWRQAANDHVSPVESDPPEPEVGATVKNRSDLSGRGHAIVPESNSTVADLRVCYWLFVGRLDLANRGHLAWAGGSPLGSNAPATLHNSGSLSQLTIRPTAVSHLPTSSTAAGSPSIAGE